jgi:hypothetical protein
MEFFGINEFVTNEFAWLYYERYFSVLVWNQIVIEYFSWFKYIENDGIIIMNIKKLRTILKMFLFVNFFFRFSNVLTKCRFLKQNWDEEKDKAHLWSKLSRHNDTFTQQLSTKSKKTLSFLSILSSIILNNEMSLRKTSCPLFPSSGKTELSEVSSKITVKFGYSEFYGTANIFSLQPWFVIILKLYILI